MGFTLQRKVERSPKPPPLLENGVTTSNFLQKNNIGFPMHWFPNGWNPGGGGLDLSLNQNHVHVEDSFQIKKTSPKSSLKPPLEHQSLLTSSCDCCFDGSSQNTQVLSNHGHRFRPRRIGLPPCCSPSKWPFTTVKWSRRLYPNHLP